jgi:hypothetical protein
MKKILAILVSCALVFNADAYYDIVTIVNQGTVNGSSYNGEYYRCDGAFGWQGLSNGTLGSGDVYYISGSLNAGQSLVLGVANNQSPPTGGQHVHFRIGSASGNYWTEDSACANNAQTNFYTLHVTVGGTVLVINTNYTFCIQNNYNVPSLATWTYNGTVVRSETLPVGGRDCWTTPSLQSFPTQQNFSVTTSIQQPIMDATSPFSSDTNGAITFGNFTPITNSVSGGAGGAFPSTNNTTGAQSPQAVPTNIVTFATPSGAASESTLQGGFSLLHGDMVNLLTGQKLQDNHVTQGLGAITNELGQVITLLWSNAQIDGQWLPQIYGAVTNNKPATNSTASGVISNFLNLSNVTVANWPSNLLTLTNGYSPTNLATESTLRGISNLLAHADRDATNGVDAQAAAGAAASSASSNALMSVVSGLPVTPADSASDTFGTPPDGSWTIHVAFGSGFDIDCNPFHRSWVASLAAFTRNLIKWALLVGLVIVCSSQLLDALRSAGANEQAREAAAAGVLKELPLLSGVIAAGCAAAIVLAATAFISFGVHWFGHYMTAIATSPFSDVSGVSTSVWIVDQFFPLAVMVAAVFSRIIFTWTLAAIVWGVQVMTRFISG